MLGADQSRGEYVLRIDGAAGTMPEFNVVATDLPDGTAPAIRATQLTVDFNDEILLSSLGASDLTLNGVPADAVTLLDPRTAVFNLPAQGEGLYELRIETGAVQDLQGTPLTAFRSTFYIDLTAAARGRLVDSTRRRPVTWDADLHGGF